MNIFSLAIIATLSGLSAFVLSEIEVNICALSRSHVGVGVKDRFSILDVASSAELIISCTKLYSGCPLLAMFGVRDNLFIYTLCHLFTIFKETGAHLSLGGEIYIHFWFKFVKTAFQTSLFCVRLQCE